MHEQHRPEGHAISKVKEEFGHRFADFKIHRTTFQSFADPFSFDVQHAPPVLQMELIDLQYNSDFKAKFREVSGKAKKHGKFERINPKLPKNLQITQADVVHFWEHKFL